MITLDGWAARNIWEHSASVRDLYARRARDEVEEMTCAAQAAELLGQLSRPGESLLDVGCGAGHFFHSIRRRNLGLDYYGVDATAPFIETGRACLAPFGFDPHKLFVGRIEDLDGYVDHVVCMNVLSNVDNFHRPLERLLQISRKTVVLRESIADTGGYSYVVDDYLDAPEPLRVHVNCYSRHDVKKVANDLGFDVVEHIDRRTGGEPEMVIGYPHYWTFMCMTSRA